MEIKDIYWIAGILEGEGCFQASNARYKTKDGWKYRKTPSPTIQLVMTDKDIIERYARLVNQNITTHKPKGKETYKQAYTCTLRGKKALEWMQTVYTLMGNRRKEKIESVINEVCHRT